MTEFEQLWVEPKLTLQNCIVEAIQRSFRVLPEVLRNPDGWDYQQLTKGFWSHLFTQMS